MARRLRHGIDRAVGHLLVEHEVVIVGEVLGVAGLRVGRGLHGAQGGSLFNVLLGGPDLRCSLIIRLQPTEFAHQFALEVDRQIIAGSLDRRLLARHRHARVEAHDPGQFRERIVARRCRFWSAIFQLVSVCHSLFRTRTQSDASDVAKGWPYQRNVGKR